MRRSLLFMMLAGVAALVAALVVYSALKKREREVQEAMAQSVNIVVATHDLHIGSQLDPTAVKLARWSRDSMPPGAFTDVAAVTGKYVKTPFVENEPIVGDRLFSGVKTAGMLPLLIPAGMRAMSVPVDEVSDIAGFVLPGAHVDIMVSISDTSTGSQPFSKIVLQNVEVLAVAQEIEEAKDEPKVVKVITVLVTPEEAERLSLASHDGTLRLALRNYEDKKIVMTNGSNVGAMLRGGAAAPLMEHQALAPVPHVAMGPARPKPIQVEILRDGHSSESISFVHGRGARNTEGLNQEMIGAADSSFETAGIEKLTPAPEAAAAASLPPGGALPRQPAAATQPMRRAESASPGPRRTIRFSADQIPRLSTCRKGEDGTMVELIRKKRYCGRKLMAVAVGAFGLLLVTGHPGPASETRTVPVTINTGESYVIQDVSKDSTPGVKVVSNPSALVVHTDAPGKVVLLGAAEGNWDIDVTLASGEKVIYAVDVKPVVSPKQPPASATNPPASNAPSPASASAAPAAASKAADAGTGPFDVAAATSGSGAATASAASASAAPAPAAVSASSAPVAAAVAPPAPAAEPVKVASADPAGPVAADVSAPAPAAATPAVAPPMVVAEASAPAYSPAAAVTSTAPVVAPSSPNGDNGMVPSQAASAGVMAPTQRFNTDPMAVIPSGPPPLGEKHFMPGDGVDLMSGTSEVLDYPTRIRRVSVADSKVADIQVINPYELNLVAHQAGFTTLAVWDTQGRYSEREIRVDENGKQQVLLNVIVAELNRSRVENFGINWTAALPKWNISLVNMAGGVATPYSPGASLTSSALISSNPPVTVSSSAQGTLPGPGSLIPLLLSQNLTYGLSAGNSNIQTQSFFQFLETNSMGKILAEPHLLANSGEKAEFLSGGEIPIVVSQALNTSIVFKQFGTSVIFVPTVIGFDDIVLKVKPEVSEPDFAHGVNLFGFTVPAFVTRKAETMVRLKNNQTLIVAGLLLNTKNETVSKVPYMGDIPYVRGLFRNTSYSNTQTDLVMTVTPQIVAPLPSNGQVALPTDRGPMNSEEIKTRRVYPDDAGRPRF